MPLHVPALVPALDKGFVAEVAAVGSSAGVDPFVLLQPFLEGEPLAAGLALERAFTRVGAKLFVCYYWLEFV